jgi:hypothetical protein
MPAWPMRAFGLINRTVREINEMRYEFDGPFIVDACGRRRSWVCAPGTWRAGGPWPTGRSPPSGARGPLLGRYVDDGVKNRPYGGPRHVAGLYLLGACPLALHGPVRAAAFRRRPDEEVPLAGEVEVGCPRSRRCSKLSSAGVRWGRRGGGGTGRASAVSRAVSS